MKNKPAATNASKPGSTKNKKPSVVALEALVAADEDTVQQATAVVSALTEKSQVFNARLTQAETSRTRALANKNTVDAIVQLSRELQQESAATLDGTLAASAKVQELAVQQNGVIRKCIVAAEVLNKLSLLIIRKKALNPLIADALIDQIAVAGRDANNAVALSLVALSSAFAAEDAALQANGAAVLTAEQAAALYAFVSENNGTDAASLQVLAAGAYAHANLYCTTVEAGYKEASRQLDAATKRLSEAQFQLSLRQTALRTARLLALGR